MIDLDKQSRAIIKRNQSAKWKAKQYTRLNPGRSKLNRAADENTQGTLI